MEDKSKEILPVSTIKETILDTVASVSSIAPWVGGPVSSVLSGMSISRKMERVNEVLLNMAKGIKGLESEIPKNYVKTEEFQELLEETLQKSAKEHNDEKRKAYSAFLINDIKNPTNDTYDEKLRFLRTLEEMQIDHIFPKMLQHKYRKSINDFSNLNPSCRRCNHYKRRYLLEEFRNLLTTLHVRVKKQYITKVAIDYGIVVLEPFDGIFYFEKESTRENQIES